MAAPSVITASDVQIDLCDESEVLRKIAARYSAGLPPLGVASINLDHFYHFGRRGPWYGALGSSLEWLNLIDGHPVKKRAEALTRQYWPRLAGSDLIDPILDQAERLGVTVGFVGGSEETSQLLLKTLAKERPNLKVAGAWSPPRSVVIDFAASEELAEEIRDTGVQLLVVGLGKPRQELWMEAHAQTSGAEVLLAFGAVVDFLAHRVRRAPQKVADAGFEWAWRLMLEPRRLARRYLVQGPPSFVKLMGAKIPHDQPASPKTVVEPERLRIAQPGRFVVGDTPAEVSVVVVTYNNAADVQGLIASLRAEAEETAIRLVVADNASADGTADKLAEIDDVTLLRTGGNLGYSGGINAALTAVPAGEHVLVLNPDLEVEPGSVHAMLDQLKQTGAGVVVPRINDFDGQLFRSLRREPTMLRAVGGALFGARFADRPVWLNDEVTDPASYDYAHPVEWGSGAAMLIDGALVAEIGRWDERYFLYSEEVDFQRRVREAGRQIWYEPAAIVRHRQGASGASKELTALMAVSQIRYFEKYHGVIAATPYRAAVALHSLARLWQPEERFTLGVVLDRSTWKDLPHATRTPAGCASGSIIIPAHNEAAVIARCLSSIARLVCDDVEVIVVCNGCTDSTAEIARGFDGVTVIELEAASKIAALNAGDAAASHASRIYLDADIEIDPQALQAVLDQLDERTAAGEFVCDAARPVARYEMTGASWPVRAYYRARNRMPGLHHSLWGAGIYGLSGAGRARFEQFPDVVADDLFVDQQIRDDRKVIVPTVPVAVHTPRDSRSLTQILRRGIRAKADSAESADSTGSTARALLSTIRGPRSAVDAVIFAAFAGASRWSARGETTNSAWERDASSRSE